jgi:Tfp pilus assembly protein PilV
MKAMKIFMLFVVAVLGLFFYNFTTQQNHQNAMFEEKNGILAVEAEHFYSQSKSQIRKWYVVDKSYQSKMTDPDPVHFITASNQQYLECLPDTRTTHDDKLTRETELQQYGWGNGYFALQSLHQ